MMEMFSLVSTALVMKTHYGVEHYDLSIKTIFAFLAPEVINYEYNRKTKDLKDSSDLTNPSAV